MAVPLRERIEVPGLTLPAFRERPIRPQTQTERIQILSDIQARLAGGQFGPGDFGIATEFAAGAPTQQERKIGQRLARNISELINTQQRLATVTREESALRFRQPPPRLLTPRQVEAATAAAFRVSEAEERLAAARQRAGQPIPALQALGEATALQEARRQQATDLSARVEQIQQQIPGISLAGAVNIAQSQIGAAQAETRAETAFQRQIAIEEIRGRRQLGIEEARELRAELAGIRVAERPLPEARREEARFRSELIKERSRIAREASETAAEQSFIRQQIEINRRQANDFAAAGIPFEPVPGSRTGAVRVTRPKPTTTRAKARLARIIQERDEAETKARSAFVDDINKRKREEWRAEIAANQSEIVALKGQIQTREIKRQIEALQTAQSDLKRKPPKILTFEKIRREREQARRRREEAGAEPGEPLFPEIEEALPGRVEVFGFSVPQKEIAALDVIVNNILQSRDPNATFNAFVQGVRRGIIRFENPTAAVTIVSEELATRGR